MRRLFSLFLAFSLTAPAPIRVSTGFIPRVSPEISDVFMRQALTARVLECRPSWAPWRRATLLRQENASLGVVRQTQNHLNQELHFIRQLLAEERYAEAEPVVEQAREEWITAVREGSVAERPSLRIYYMLKVWSKVVKGHVGMFRRGEGKSSVQILVFDHSGDRVLLQRRGPYKRLFPNVWTVSANVKPKPGQDFREAASVAVRGEIGLTLCPERFAMVGQPGSYDNRLISYDFYALDEAEHQSLQWAAALETSFSQGLKGLRLSYDDRNWKLTLLSVDPRTTSEDVRAAAHRLRHLTGVPFVHPVFDDDHNSVVTARLTPDEESQVAENAHAIARAKERAEARLSAIPTEADLQALDADEPAWYSWDQARRQFKRTPQEFALDLTTPYLARRAFAEAIHPGPALLSVDDPRAADVECAGGKGSNTHFIRQLQRHSVTGAWIVPETTVIITHAYDRWVLGNPMIARAVEEVEAATAEEKVLEAAARVRELIMTVQFPVEFSDALKAEFQRLGGDIAIRSSATVEDGPEFSAAGQADSFLHVTDANQVLDRVRSVMASLFSDRFVLYRRQHHLPHREASMAVLMQSFVDARAAGVVYSFHDETLRPAYQISATSGLGEGVVEEKGHTDLWLVGLLGDVIFHRAIIEKLRRVVAARGGGTREESFASSEPSLTDEEVLRIGRAVRVIAVAYKKAGRADHIDVEFAMDRQGRLFIVQARAKAPPSMETVNGRTFYRVRRVEESGVRPMPRVIQIKKDAPLITHNAVTAPLQLIYENKAVQARPGVILVTHHTNNEWNDVFAKVAAIITADGDRGSHAAQNSQKLGVPCIVGASDVMTLLAPYDGQLVTFDPEQRKIYLGRMPIVEEQRTLDIWLSDMEDLEASVSHRESHEIFRPWEESLRKRPEVFLDDFEAHWRRRSNRYRAFELDYYWRAWDELTDMLTKKFGDRAPWTLETQDRKIYKNTLFQRLEPNDPRGIFEWIAQLKDRSIADLESLFEDRWRGFERLARFLQGIDRVEAANAGAFVGEMVEAFIWMHFGFWLDVSVDYLYASAQLKYIAEDFHPALMEEAVRGSRTDRRIAPDRMDVPAGDVLDLSRAKDREMYAVLERLRADPPLLALMAGAGKPAWQENGLRQHAPDLFARIEGWSMKYKKFSEHLDRLSDTEDYLSDLGARLRDADTASLPLLAEAMRRRSDHTDSMPSAEALRKDDDDLYWLIMGRARLLAARKAFSTFDSEPAAKGTRLNAILLSDVAAAWAAAMAEIGEEIRRDAPRREAAVQALHHFPDLKRVAALFKKELLLREDGHHLIVPMQRRAARLMLDVGERFAHILGKADRVFDLTTAEFVGLLRDPDPTYIAQSPARGELLQVAERQLMRDWKRNPSQAVKRYAQLVNKALGLLADQRKRTHMDSLRDFYDAEEKRWTDRIAHLQRLASVRDTHRRSSRDHIVEAA